MDISIDFLLCAGRGLQRVRIVFKMAIRGGQAMYRHAFLMLLLLVPGTCLAQHCDAGLAAYDAARFKQAIEIYNVCLAHSAQDDAVVHYRRARAYIRVSDYARARADLDRALALDDGYALSWNSRAWLSYLQGDLSAATQDIEKALSLNHASALIYDTQAHILAAKGEPAKAMQAFESGIRYQSRAGIAKIQRNLARSGIDPGPVDGIYGPRTRAALKTCARTQCNIWQWKGKR